MIYAVAIVEDVSVEKIYNEAGISEAGYKAVKQRYEDYCARNRIEFTTFHQSYGYEEFIEGIRPVMSNEIDDTETSDDKVSNIEYELRPGIFKRICEESRASIIEEDGNTLTDYSIDRDATVWKISLEGAGDNETRRDCLKHNYIRIGWDEHGEDIDSLDKSAEGYTILKAFKNKMKIGDIVLSCFNKRTIDAIGIVTGEYEYLGTKKYYNRARTVDWIVKGINEDIVDINGGKVLTLSTLYRLKNISVVDIINIIKKYKVFEKHDYHNENYVMIIDEINRGNISKIFGELITLIEKTKREGADEEMHVTLPYSQKQFSIPKNVYILGTMNTADRSIAMIDTALRRRFSFKEMMPQPELLSQINISSEGKILELDKMLEKINERITYLYDREHTIGHAFFLGLKKSDDKMEKIAEIFKESIIPLLQEYFYEDYYKIQLVLGDNGKTEEFRFILGHPVKNKGLFAKNTGDTKKIKDIEIEEDEFVYEIQESALKNIESYINIYS